MALDGLVCVEEETKRARAPAGARRRGLLTLRSWRWYVAYSPPGETPAVLWSSEWVTTYGLRSTSRGARQRAAAENVALRARLRLRYGLAPDCPDFVWRDYCEEHGLTALGERL
jgi:hypothetical protein